MHLPDIAPVVAAGIDWLEGLLPLLFVLFWIISQVVNVIRRVAGEGGRPQPAPVVPKRPPAPADDAREALERQIDEFLRQSRGGRDREPAAKPAAPRPQTHRPRPPLGEAGDDIAEHVDGAFAHDLSHRMSPSSPAGSGSVQPGNATAAELAAALRDPTTLRRLVLVREVLERPIDRWE